MIDVSNLKLLSHDDPILSEPTKEFDFADAPCNPIELVNALTKIMNDNQGIGLAANQIGVPYSVFVMRVSERPIAVFNPRIVSMSNEIISLAEGCLSWPGLYVKIKRPKHIRARFQNERGETDTHMFTGMTARCFQHEMDHMSGIEFWRHANKFHRDQGMRKWDLWKKRRSS